MFAITTTELSRAGPFTAALTAHGGGTLRVRLFLAERFGQDDAVLDRWETRLAAGQTFRLSLDEPGRPLALRAEFTGDDGEPLWARTFRVERGGEDWRDTPPDGGPWRGRRLHVVARDIWRGDAVGNFALDMARLAAAHGARVRLYAENHHPDPGAAITHPEDLPRAVGADDVVVFHASTFDPSLDLVLGLTGRKVAYFHNITPAEFFRPFDPATARRIEQAHAQIPRLAGFDAVLANSTTTARLLPQAAVTVIPPVLYPGQRWAIEPAPLPKEWRDAPYLLSVGRIAPHKGILDLMSLFGAVSERDPSLRLIVAGTPACAAYHHEVSQAAARLPGRVILTGAVDDALLLSLYRHAAGLISLSGHEGFGIPVLEALGFGLPLFLSADPAMGELAEDAAVILAGCDWPVLADTVLAALPGQSGEGARRRRRERYAQLAGRCDGRDLLAALWGDP